MSLSTLPKPPSGIDRNVYDYLFQLSERLNLALRNLSAENFSSDSEAKTVLSGGLSKEQQKTLQDGLGNLKSLIIKTIELHMNFL